MVAVGYGDRQHRVMEAIDEPVALSNSHFVPLLPDSVLKLSDCVWAVRSDTSVQCRPQVLLGIQIRRLSRYSLHLRHNGLEVAQTASAGVQRVIVLNITKAIRVEAAYRRHHGVKVLPMLGAIEPAHKNPQTRGASAADAAKDLHSRRMCRLSSKREILAVLDPGRADDLEQEERLLIRT